MSSTGAAPRRAELSGRAALSSDRVEELVKHWEVLRCDEGEVADAGALGTAHDARFVAAKVPGTAAQVFGIGPELATRDHVYRCRFGTTRGRARRTLLCFDGLATLAEVWWNGELVLTSTSMFETHALDVTASLRTENEIVIRFAALQPVLRERRPRGRWPVPLVTEKNLRFLRTTVLGHMPGFCPEAVPVGPWRGVRLVHQEDLGLERVSLFPVWKHGAAELDLSLRLRQLGPVRVAGARLTLGNATVQLACEQSPDHTVLISGGTLRRDLAPWWPHTHGTPALHAASLEVQCSDGRTVGIPLGELGFRSVELANGSLEDFALRWNGERVFCRGGALPPLDARSLHVDPAGYEKALALATTSGVNMLRVVGNFVYEADAFYLECDRRGVLVFQDFMFANMDYPVADAEWRGRVRREATGFLERTSGRACLAVLCGNTEVAQQAAMMGLPASEWSNELFDRELPELCTSFARGIPYAPSSPFGGPLPFAVGAGLSHYYGVGGYRRALHDPRLARPRFASECLAFAIPPCAQTLEEWLGTPTPAVTDARYTARIPRDLGANWTFADVTDHYVRELFAEDPEALRHGNPERALALSRAAVAEAMVTTFAQLRRTASGCSGALVWLMHDLHDSAGLGLVDGRGRPKAPLRALARIWQPVAVWFVDDGLDGVSVHVANDRPAPLAATLRIALFRTNGTVVEQVDVPVHLAGRSEVRHCVDAALGHFADSSYAYRFGAPSHVLIVAWLLPTDGTAPLSRAFHLPLGYTEGLRGDPALRASLAPLAEGRFVLTTSADRFAHSVTVRADGYAASDDHFHVAPAETVSIVLAPLSPGMPPPTVRLRALDSERELVVVAP